MRFEANLNTLRYLLESDGVYPAAEIELCIRGRLPHTFSSNTLALNRIRTIFINFTEESVFSENGKLNFAKILVRLQPCLPNDPVELYAFKTAADQIIWTPHSQDNFHILWPNIIYSTHFPHIKTACRFMILAQLLEYYPELIEQNLTVAIENFDNENLHCAFSILQQQKNAMNVSLTAEIRALKDMLAFGPKTRRELQEGLHVKRGILLKKYLYPAEKLNLIAKTGRKSSDPFQKYILK